MGKYMIAKVENALDNGFIRFCAKFTWNASSDGDANIRFSHYRDYVGNEHNENEHTGIQKNTLQGYYLKSPNGVASRRFVIIGLHNPKKKKSRHGLETYCKRLIYGTGIQADFGHPVEALELEHSHGPNHDDDYKPES